MIRETNIIAKTFAAIAIYPTVAYPTIFPAPSCVMIKPANVVARPMANDCMVELSDMKVPRSFACAAEVTMAIAGIMRPETSTKNVVVQISHSHSGSIPAWLITNNGNKAAAATNR